MRGEVETGIPRALDEVVERGEAGGRVPRRRAVTLAQHLDQRAQLDQRLLARALDDDERLVDLLGVGAAQVEGDRRLHVDERHVVGDDVVQLLGDAQPVLPGPAAALLGEGPPVADARSLRTRATSAKASTSSAQATAAAAVGHDQPRDGSRHAATPCAASTPPATSQATSRWPVSTAATSATTSESTTGP